MKPSRRSFWRSASACRRSAPRLCERSRKGERTKGPRLEVQARGRGRHFPLESLEGGEGKAPGPGAPQKRGRRKGARAHQAEGRWHARHDRRLKDSDFVDNQQEDADIDTEVIDAEGNEAQAESRREFRPLTRAERNSDRVDADDEEELYEKERERKERPKADGRYSADPDVAAEQRKKRNQKRNARRNALKRKLGSEWDPGHKKRNKRQRHQEKDEEEDADYDDYRLPRPPGR